MGKKAEDPVADTYIGQLGMGDKVRLLLRRHAGSSRIVVNTLARDPEFKSARDAHDGGRRLTTSDIHDFLTADAISKKIQEHREEMQEVKLLALQVPQPKGVVERSEREMVAAREFFVKTTALAEDWWRVANHALRVLEDDMREYVELKDQPVRYTDDGQPIVPRPPVELLDAARKAFLAVLDAAKTIKNDPVIKNVMQAENVIVQQGMTEKEFLDKMFAIGRKLGSTQAKILEAYSMVIAEGSGQAIIDVVPLPPEPEFRRREAAALAARRAAEAEASRPPAQEVVQPAEAPEVGQ